MKLSFDRNGETLHLSIRLRPVEASAAVPVIKEALTQKNVLSDDELNLMLSSVKRELDEIEAEEGGRPMCIMPDGRETRFYKLRRLYDSWRELPF